MFFAMHHINVIPFTQSITHKNCTALVSTFVSTLLHNLLLATPNVPYSPLVAHIVHADHLCRMCISFMPNRCAMHISLSHYRPRINISRRQSLFIATSRSRRQVYSLPRRSIFLTAVSSPSLSSSSHSSCLLGFLPIAAIRRMYCR